MKLTIVIPALNEEGAITSIIERCIAAREHIVSHSPVRETEIIVVSDGSTDRTTELAAAFDDVKLIVFEQNRGYGAAIKEGFAQGEGDLVGFLDADGTCDPSFFADLCDSLITEDAAVALGSRLGAQSRMPAIRRLGNRIYAFILSVLSNKVVTDTASGMRVIRRDALSQLYPLPDGLNFTPAMSARVLMDDRLRIVELPMSYEERIGESKLHVLRDGLRFLDTIFEMTMMYKPAKLFFFTAVLCLGISMLLAMHPFEMWLRLGRLQEDMIYRLLFCAFLGTIGVSALSWGVTSRLLARLVDENPPPQTFFATIIDKFYSPAGVGWQALIAIPLLVWLVGEGAWTRITEGHVYLHWSRVALAGFIAFALVQGWLAMFVANVIRFHTLRKSTRRDEGRSGAQAHGLEAKTTTPKSAVLNVDIGMPKADDQCVSV